MPDSDDRPPEPVNDGQSQEQQQQRSAPDVTPTSKSQPQPQATPSSQSSKRSATVPLTLSSSTSSLSPKTSRDTSPVRPTPLKLGQNVPKLSRSRKNSQDLSPHRTTNTAGHPLPETPSAAAIQRALSAAPRLTAHSNGEPSTEPQKPQRTPRGTTTSTPNSANTSSRVKSPPNSASSGRATSSSTSSRKGDQEPHAPTTPRIVVDDGAGKSTRNFESIAEEEDDEDMPSGMKSPGRAKSSASALEAVQESSLPETPAFGAAAPLQNGKVRSSRSSVHESSNAKDVGSRAGPANAESGSESGGNKNTAAGRREPARASKAPPSSKPTPLKTNNSFTQLASSKNKPTGEGSAKNMLVETETVASIANSGIGGSGQRESSGKADTGGTLRLKQSSETIKPKKEKKKVVRKAPSIHSGTASSKADIFEANVARAVDDADSSDSEETFVYESNPPETRPNRYHSRTPSAASTASADHYGGRFRSDGHNSVVGKKSMKFANSSHHFKNNADAEDGSHSGTVGGGRGSGANNPHHHHHIGRHGRAVGHTSLFDSDSPFSNSNNKSLQNVKNGKATSRPNSPRSPFTPRGASNSKAHKMVYSLEDDAADDERTPLINGRSSRTRSRRPAQYGNYSAFRPQNSCRGLVGYLLMGFLVISLVIVVIVALIFCSKPLTGVRITDLKNVIASEEEIVFDIHVHARNPNIVAVQVTKLDVKIFAKSKYVGSSKLDRGPIPRQLRTESAHRSLTNGTSDRHPLDNVDEGTDPIEEPIGVDTMLLGRVLELDSPLNFEPSPTNNHISSDLGEISLRQPGNATADDGSQRWKTVVQHTFQLIVVGQLRYTLPINSEIHSVSMGQAKTTVDPDRPVGEKTINFNLRAEIESVPPDSKIRRRTITFIS